MKKVYFYLKFIELRTNDSGDHVVDERFFGQGNYGVIQSGNFSTIEDALEDRQVESEYYEVSPIMEGWIDDK